MCVGTTWNRSARKVKIGSCAGLTDLTQHQVAHVVRVHRVPVYKNGEGRRHDKRGAPRARARVSRRTARQEQSDDVGGALARGNVESRPPIGSFLVWVSSST